MMGGREESGREERRSQVQGRIIDTEAPVACGGGFFSTMPLVREQTRHCAQTHTHTCTHTHTHTHSMGASSLLLCVRGLLNCSVKALGLVNETDAKHPS